ADRRRRCADSLNKAPVYKAKTPEATSIAAFASEISVFRPFQANSRIEPAGAFGVGSAFNRGTKPCAESLERSPSAMSYRSSWRVCGGSSIAATIRPALPCSTGRSISPGSARSARCACSMRRSSRPPPPARSASPTRAGPRAVVSEHEPERLIVAREGCPVVLGLGKDENFVASDVAALLPVTRRFVFLEEGDVAEVRRRSVRVIDRDGHVVERAVRESDLSA